MFSFFEEISSSTGLPFDILTTGFRVINLSNRAIYVEGYNNIIDVSSSEINIKLKKGIIKITGNNIKIKNMNIETLIIIGDIESVEMC